MKQLRFEPSPSQDLAPVLLVMLITNQLQTFHPLVNLHLHQSNLDASFPVTAKTLCQQILYCVVDIKISDIYLEKLSFRSYKLVLTSRAGTYMEAGIQKFSNFSQSWASLKKPCLIIPSDLEFILKKLVCSFPWEENKGYNILWKHFLSISEAQNLFSFFLWEGTERGYRSAEWKEIGERGEYLISFNSRNPVCGLEVTSEEESKQGKCSPAQTCLSGYSLSKELSQD